MTSRADAIKRIFSAVGPTYDLVNRLLTLGLDVAWRKRAARLARRGGGRRWLDVCSGTGDMARALTRVAPRGVKVTASDFSMPMLRFASRKATRRPFDRVCSELPRLPFPDASFDLATISFATRNINLDRPALQECFHEVCRVLRPGGRLVNLETSQPPNRFLRTLFHLYVRTAVKPLGRAISGSPSGYAYLSSTIPRFYEAPVLAGILRTSGFERVTYQHDFFGAVAIHTAVKKAEPLSASGKERRSSGQTRGCPPPRLYDIG
ncbi:MAG: hypothetical protein A2Y56_09085 [Candidatus Aminicenantes bacterium RBG_13_63_10]|nr:MAG: hypothetical protein A2Y56_09085 [Candidatus Aminicenantes bacterium RBG_13_63_10]